MYSNLFVKPSMLFIDAMHINIKSNSGLKKKEKKSIYTYYAEGYNLIKLKNALPVIIAHGSAVTELFLYEPVNGRQMAANYISYIKNLVVHINNAYKFHHV